MLNGHTLNKDTPVPLYHQLKMLILNCIKDGTYKSGDLIPTENELSSSFDISRTTVRQAVTELVQEGYLYRIKSKGTFVCKPKVTQNVMNRFFTYDSAARDSGREVIKVDVLKMEVIPMPEEVQKLCGGAPGERVIYLYRRRLSEGEPLSRVKTYLLYEKFPDLLDEDLENHKLAEIMNRKPETKVSKLKRTIEAIPAVKEDIELLEVEEGSAIQKMTTVRHNAEGEFLDVSYAYYRGDMHRVEVEIVFPEN